MLCAWVFHRFQLKKTAFGFLGHHVQDFSHQRPPDLKVIHSIRNLPKDPPSLTTLLTRLPMFYHKTFFLSYRTFSSSICNSLKWVRKTMKNMLLKHAMFWKATLGPHQQVGKAATETATRDIKISTLWMSCLQALGGTSNERKITRRLDVFWRMNNKVGQVSSTLSASC